MRLLLLSFLSRERMKSASIPWQLMQVAPSFFAHGHCPPLADGANCHNSHKMTATEDSRQAIIAKHGDGNEEEPLLGEPQNVELSFIVKHAICKWEIQTFENDDKDFVQHMQEIQKVCFVLTVAMLSAEKHLKRKDGNFHLFGSPQLGDDMENDDDESGNEH